MADACELLNWIYDSLCIVPGLWVSVPPITPDTMSYNSIPGVEKIMGMSLHEGWECSCGWICAPELVEYHNEYAMIVSAIELGMEAEVSGRKAVQGSKTEKAALGSQELGFWICIRFGYVRYVGWEGLVLWPTPAKLECEIHVQSREKQKQ